MLSPLAKDVYTLNAAAISQDTPREKITPPTAPENHDAISPQSMHDEAVKVSISEQVQNMIELVDGQQTAVEQNNRAVLDYKHKLHKRRSSHHD